MYCVKCGVKLGSGTEKCPLCDTPVWNPDGYLNVPQYPDLYPERRGRKRQAAAAVITFLSLVACITVFLICEKMYHAPAWSGIVVFGIVLVYIAGVLPLWFRHPNPVIFIPITYTAAGIYMLYLNGYFSGQWFLSFAFPITAMSLVITEAFAVLMKYVRGGRYYIFGGLFFLIGAFAVLVEFFAHITFDTPVFVWSLYAAGACSAVAVILILAGIIRPMREFFNRMFFI